MPECEIVAEWVNAEAYQQNIAHCRVDKQKSNEYPHMNELYLEYFILAAQKRNEGADIKVSRKQYEHQNAYVLARSVGKSQMQHRVEHARHAAGGTLYMKVTVQKAVDIRLKHAVGEQAVRHKYCGAEQYRAVEQDESRPLLPAAAFIGVERGAFFR